MSVRGISSLDPLDPKEIEKFLPIGFPKLLPDGRVPLRYQIFKDKSVLRTVLTKPKKGVFMCSHCDLSFTQFSELLDHYDEYKIKRPHKCSHHDCPWKIVGFNRLRQLTRHEASIHNSSLNLVCLKCSKKFGRIDLLNRHTKNVHDNANSRFNKKMAKFSTTHASEAEQNSPNVTPKVGSPHSENQKQAQEQTASQDSKEPDTSYKHSIDFLTS
ncbi:hypothetical protein WICPIJ_006675 [Wickerhamomyces pijperi]|uniref:C2H2-type domain-containing protein n=1 Tax=Wickerhamomyces pijperi TaxID=599730 RepID=A0A9P8Q1L6_WICPI|nr:hypothetical protein WICPIJ_006675 [Wickerhamomyces pijperi]